MEACLAGAGNTERVTQQADRTELYWGRRDEDVVQGQDLNYRTRRRMPVYVRCDLCDDVIRRAALHHTGDDELKFFVASLAIKPYGLP